jgi:Ca2+-binding EF-hand superfamily protein
MMATGGIETKSPEWINETKGQIKEAFDLFDTSKSGAIIQEEVGTVMRALGAYPDERELVLTYLPEMQDDEPTNFVSFEKFEKFMLKILATRECEPDSSELLLQAFRTIDADNNGYISADVFEALLTSKGTAFRSKELEAFMLIAKNVETGNIFYEDYIALLTR